MNRGAVWTLAPGQCVRDIYGGVGQVLDVESTGYFPPYVKLWGRPRQGARWQVFQRVWTEIDQLSSVEAIFTLAPPSGTVAWSANCGTSAPTGAP